MPIGAFVVGFVVLNFFLFCNVSRIPRCPELIWAVPFEPFAVVTSSGQHYEIPTRDHAGLNPKGSRVVIWFDDDSSITISSLHILALEKKTLPGGSNSEQDCGGNG